MTIRNSIIKYLEENKGWQFGGSISRRVAQIHEVKESNVERRERELEDEQMIESRYVENPNGGNKVVQYRIKQVEIPIVGAVKDGWIKFRPEFLKEKLLKENQKSLL